MKHYLHDQATKIIVGKPSWTEEWRKVPLHRLFYFFALCGESATSGTGRAVLAGVPTETWLALEAAHNGDKARAWICMLVLGPSDRMTKNACDPTCVARNTIPSSVTSPKTALTWKVTMLSLLCYPWNWHSSWRSSQESLSARPGWIQLGSQQ
jgi:hypothetical protein